MIQPVKASLTTNLVRAEKSTLNKELPNLGIQGQYEDRWILRLIISSIHLTPTEMPMKTALLALIALGTATPAFAGGDYQPGYSTSSTCIRNEYREEYTPGTSEKNPGVIRSWNEQVVVPCDSSGATTVRKAVPQKVDDNDCSEGSLIGGLLGAGLATSGSRGRDRWWAIPAGGAAGAMIGCQIDGG